MSKPSIIGYLTEDYVGAGQLLTSLGKQHIYMYLLDLAISDYLVRVTEDCVGFGGVLLKST